MRAMTNHGGKRFMARHHKDGYKYHKIEQLTDSTLWQNMPSSGRKEDKRQTRVIREGDIHDNSTIYTKIFINLFEPYKIQLLFA
jgi:hypothetical protein